MQYKNIEEQEAAIKKSEDSLYISKAEFNEEMRYLLDKIIHLSEGNAKLADLLDKLHDNVVELEKWRAINESLYSNG